MAEDPAKKTYIFGRQKHKKLSPRQLDLIENSLPNLQIDPLQPFGTQPLWAGSADLWLEIGFGGGEHLAHMAGENPDINFIGCEPFINGIAKLLVAIEDKNLQNIRIYDNDARHVITWLPEASLSRVYLLYPDPWPKSRHHKRRFVTTETLAMLARVMKPGSDLIVASDIEDYIRTSLLALEQSPDFIYHEEQKAEWHIPPEGWSGTRYEQKAFREGRKPTYLKIKRAG